MKLHVDLTALFECVDEMGAELVDIDLTTVQTDDDKEVNKQKIEGISPVDNE